MKIELSKRLLRDIIEPIIDDETKIQEIFSELQFLGECKYDHYEMYAPGRHFLEHFYLWLKQFKQKDRKTALDLICNHLIFISRHEFELLSDVLYWETVRKIQFDLAAQEEKIEKYQVAKIAKSNALKQIERRTLYIGMSDGARLDYFRRQNRQISNEQVLISYHVDQQKCEEMIQELEDYCGTGTRFKLLFLIDDFCASGSTLIRINEKEEVKGSLLRLEEKKFGGKKLLSLLLADDCKILLCPLLATQKTVNHLESFIHKLSSQLKDLEVKPVAVLDDKLSIRSNKVEIGQLSEKYYQRRMEDDHTGNVMFGYKECGLTVVLHHNTPNNSLYLLWNRLAKEADGTNPSFRPLFERFERHRSTKS